MMKGTTHFATPRKHDKSVKNREGGEINGGNPRCWGEGIAKASTRSTEGRFSGERQEVGWPRPLPEKGTDNNTNQFLKFVVARSRGEHGSGGENWET